MGMCELFFKDATKIQNSHQSSPNVFEGANIFKLTSQIIQILQSHSPRYGDVQVIFKVLVEFKMAATDQLQFFVGAYGDVQVIF